MATTGEDAYGLRSTVKLLRLVAARAGAWEAAKLLPGAASYLAVEYACRVALAVLPASAPATPEADQLSEGKR